MNAAQLPPLDRNAVDDADANLDRQIAFLRAELLKPRHPSRLALVRSELRQAEGLRAGRSERGGAR